MQEIARQLDQLRSMTRRLVFVRATGLLLASAIPPLLLLAAADWLWRFPTGTRWIFLLAWLGILFLLWKNILLPAARFRPTRVSIAHRLERSNPALRGRCVPVVELEETSQMAANSIKEASLQVSRIRIQDTLSIRPAMTWLLAGLGVFTVVAVLFILLPSTALTGSSRVLLPWLDARWPARTAVESLMDTTSRGVHGRGTPLLLRAANRTPAAPSGMVHVTYRLLDETGNGDWRTELLTDQGGGIHERIVSSLGSHIEFRFNTEDASTDLQQYRLIELPRILEAGLTMTPPAWASSRIPDRILWFEDGSRLPSEVRPPILAGSRVQLTIRTNRSIPGPAPGTAAQWSSEVLGWTTENQPVVTWDPGDPLSMSIQWTMEHSLRFILQPRDTHGLQSTAPWVLSLASRPDRKPTIAIVSPSRDQSVLPTASLSLISTGSDDIGLSSLGFELHPDSSATQPASASSMWRFSKPVEGMSESLEYELDLGTMQLETGTVLNLYATATDLHPGEHGVGRVTYSTPRRIQIVDHTTFMSMIRQRLGLLEQRTRQLEERQAALQRLVRSGAWTIEDQREQAAISRAIEDQESILEDIWSELGTNRASDERIESLLKFSEGALGRAEVSSRSAIHSMAAGDTSEEVLEDQDAVRFELQELVALLGEDEESWVVIQRLEQFIEAQLALQERTAATSADILGLERSEMTRAQIDHLDSLASEQLSLTKNALSLVDALANQARSLKDISDERAEVMEQALEIAETSNLVDEVQEASRQITDARIESAVQTQQQVVDTLAAVRGAMEPAEGGGIQELARRFEDIKDAIQRLVAYQRRELLALDAIVSSGPAALLDESMIRLRTNTLSVADDTRRMGDQARVVARTLDLAAGAQGGAVSSLRRSPIDAEGARIQEELSLEYLESVLAAVTSMADQARSQAMTRGRDDLASRYEALAEREVSVYQSSTDLQGRDLDRRTRFELRRLSRIQEEIRLELLEVVDSIPELEKARIFQHAHTRLDALATDVRESLVAGNVDSLILFKEQSIIKQLHGLSDALNSTRGEGEFSESQAAGGGESSQGSGEQPLVPPIAEIKLLRSMQQEILDSTGVVNAREAFLSAHSGMLLEELAHQQQSLAELGSDMIRRMQKREQGGTDVQMPVHTPPGWWRAEQSPDQENHPIVREDWPDLDELLDLEPEGSGQDDFPPIPPSAEREEKETPLHSAVDGMRAAAQRLEGGHGGLETQRVQREVVAHLDALLDMAQRQRSPSSRTSGEGSSQATGQEPGSGSGTPLDTTGGAGETLGEAHPPPGRDPMLGGVIEESLSEWGSLPSRVREMLRQGRQDRYSVIYERMTAEYYRRLAEEAGRD